MKIRLVLSTLLIALLSPLSAQKEAKPESYDVVVYSGVPCGIAAAIMAKREGASVLLIEPEKHIGGLSTSGINTAESE
ncbi:MAG TPA: FAD-dependent oxidoreductase, partial [Candidatus Saccharimonadia bacterium]|nr:FAD-dependent oxidoreductase [Candidatus Saccharimonadia bacterium]